MTPTHKKGEKIMLSVTKREVFGKKLTSLRAEGNIPANIFGKDFASTAITIVASELMQAFRSAGETQVIYLVLGKDEIPALIADMQLDPRTDAVVHVDFRKVNLRQKTEAQVPIILVGEPIAVAQKLGDLLTLVDSVTIEALPADMPSEIEVDVSGLAEIDACIKIADLKLPAGCVVHEDAEEMIAKIAEHKEEDLTPAMPEGEVAEPSSEAPSAEGATEGDAGAEKSAE